MGSFKKSLLLFGQVLGYIVTIIFLGFGIVVLWFYIEDKWRYEFYYSDFFKKLHWDYWYLIVVAVYFLLVIIVARFLMKRSHNFNLLVQKGASSLRRSVLSLALGMMAMGVVFLALTIFLDTTQHSVNLPRILSKHYTIPADNRIVLDPSGISFVAPNNWVESYKRDRNNFYLSKDVLDIVQKGNFEWNFEAVEIVNNLISFKNLQAVLASKAYFSEEIFYPLDSPQLQTPFLRIYEITSEPPALQLLIAQEVSSTLAKVITIDDNSHLIDIDGSNDSRPPLRQNLVNGWYRSLIQFSVWYGDYGGEQAVDFRIKRFGDRTLVFVFIVRDQLETEVIETEAILKSVEIRKN